MYFILIIVTNNYLLVNNQQPVQKNKFIKQSFTLPVNKLYFNLIKPKTESLSTQAVNRVQSWSVEKAVSEVEHETVN